MPEALKPKQAKPINPKEIIAIVLRRKWLVILPLVIVTGISYAGTYLLIPKYESSTIVWIDRPSTVSRELISLIGSERGGRESVHERQSRLLALQTEITSQIYLVQLIRDLKLDDDPEITRQVSKLCETSAEYSLEQLKYNLLVERLRDQIRVSHHGYDQIKITVESHDPKLARDMAERLAEILEKEKTKYEMEKILDNQTFTDMQLQKTEYYYQLAVDSLNAAQARLSRLQLPENIASETNRLDILSGIDRIKLERDDYLNEVGTLRAQLAGSGLSQARLNQTDAIGELRATINGLVSTYADMMEKYAWNEQNVLNVSIRLNNSMKLLEQEIAAAVEDQYVSHSRDQTELLKRYFVAEEHLDVLNSKQEGLRNTLDKIDERTRSVPQLQSEIVELQNRVQDARRYRDAFRSEEATVGILSEQVKGRTKYKVIEPAVVPLAPFWPDKRKIVLMGFILGAVLGAGAVLLTEILDNSFRRVEDIERELGLPVLAIIPKVEELKHCR